MCTDGLYSEIAAKELEMSVTSGVGKENQEALLLGLVEQAKSSGGHDNITVIGLQCNEAFPRAEAGERPRFMSFPFLKEDNPYARMFQIQG
jgi:serine/threonine protein phosphatase PrpC